MPFKVQHKKSKSIYDVYNIRYDSFNNVYFLIYEDDEWKELPANSCMPLRKVLNG